VAAGGAGDGAGGTTGADAGAAGTGSGARVALAGANGVVSAGVALLPCLLLAAPPGAISLQSQPLWSAVGTQLYFLPGWNVSTLPYFGSSACAVAPIIIAIAASARAHSANRMR
jgi:hypothetical protein